MLGTATGERWHDAVSARVGISLLLLVVLIVPGFLLILQNSRLVLYFLFYPLAAALGLWLIAKGQTYAGSLVLVLSVYGVVTWIAWHIGFGDVNKLKWWIIALLPWVLFNEKNKATILLASALPVGFSFLSFWMPPPPDYLSPGEREFMRQILRSSVALGAFSCIFFLRQAHVNSERQRKLDNEFYLHTFEAIPLPLIIKDSITLEYVFYNQAARLTFDLQDGQLNTNQTTFAESTANAVSRLDFDVLRGAAYHIEQNESFLHTTGINWYFRTYRIPLELKSSGRRLLIMVSEDLHALELTTRKAESEKVKLSRLQRLLQPLQFVYDADTQQLDITEDGRPSTNQGIRDYLTYYLPRLAKGAVVSVHAVMLAGEKYQIFLESAETPNILTGVIIALHD